MKFQLKTGAENATVFDAIGAAGMAAEVWFNSETRGERYQFEIYQRHGKVGYVVRVSDDFGRSAGHLAKGA